MGDEGEEYRTVDFRHLPLFERVHYHVSVEKMLAPLVTRRDEVRHKGIDATLYREPP